MLISEVREIIDIFIERNKLSIETVRALKELKSIFKTASMARRYNVRLVRPAPVSDEDFVKAGICPDCGRKLPEPVQEDRGGGHFEMITHCVCGSEFSGGI